MKTYIRVSFRKITLLCVFLKVTVAETTYTSLSSVLFVASELTFLTASLFTTYTTSSSIPEIF